MLPRPIAPGGVQARLRILALVLVTACGDDPEPGEPSPAPVASVSLNFVDDTFVVRSPVILVPTLRDAAGNVLEDREITWSTSDPAIGTVDADGHVSTLAVGTVTVTASSEGQSAAARITLVPRVTVLRRLPSTFAGDTTLLIAALTDITGAPIAAGPVEWSSSDESVATAGPTGVVTGVAPGSATISASVTGASGSTELVVLDRTPRSNREIGYITTVFENQIGRDELRSVGPDGAGDGPIIADDHGLAEFRWAPSGDRIVALYTEAAAGPGLGLHTTAADGSDERELVPQSALGTALPRARWSPDGQRLVFGAGSPMRIFRVNADGTGLIHLTPVSTLQGDDRGAEWSPDGRRIAYHRDPIFQCGELRLMNADGTGSAGVELPVQVCEIAWSPDGKVLAMVAFGLGDGTEGIWLVNDDGGNPRPFTPNCSPDGVCTGDQRFRSLTWSPDGTRLAYITHPVTSSGPVRIHVSDLARSDVVDFEIGDGLSPAVDWSPDGTLLVYPLRLVATDPPQLVVSRPDGSGRVPIATGEHVRQPAWRR